MTECSDTRLTSEIAVYVGTMSLVLNTTSSSVLMYTEPRQGWHHPAI
jgi:hypothetical protein